MSHHDNEHDPRGVSVETLESRICLSSPHGGDFGFAVGLAQHGAVRHAGGPHGGGGSGAGVMFSHAHLHAAAKNAMKFAGGGFHGGRFAGGDFDGGGFHGGRFDGGGFAVAARSTFGSFANGESLVRASRTTVFVLVIPAQPTFGPPVIDLPTVRDHTGSAGPVQAPVRGGGAVTSPNAARQVLQQPPAQDAAAAEGVSTPAPDPDELLAAVTHVSGAGDDGTAAAAATTPVAAETSAATVGSAIERLTSSWHDGSVAGDVAQHLVAQWLPATANIDVTALAATVLDAAGDVLAPLAETIDSVVAPTAAAAAYEIAHLGSPFTLLADSLATFVEESAAVSDAVAAAQSRGPWVLTVGVIAADLVILSYVYRRKTTRRRVQLAAPGIA